MTGGRIILSEGTHTHTGLTLNKANLVLEGQGPSSNLVLAANSDADNIGISANDVHVKNLKITGSSASQATTDVRGLSEGISVASGALRARLIDLEITDTRDEGIYIAGHGAWVIRPYIHDLGAASGNITPRGVSIQSASFVWVLFGRFDTCGDDPIYGGTARYCHVAYNVINNPLNGHAIPFYSTSTNNTLGPNNIIACLGAAYRLDIGCDKNTIIVGTVRSPGWHGVWCNQADDNDIGHGVIELAGRNGVLLDGSQYNNVHDLVIKDSSQATNNVYGDIRLTAAGGIDSAYNRFSNIIGRATQSNKATRVIIEEDSDQGPNYYNDIQAYGHVNAAPLIRSSASRAYRVQGWTGSGEVVSIFLAIDHADLTDNGDATAYADFADAIPAGSIIKAVKCDFTEAFNSDDTTTLTMMIGSTGDLDAFSLTASPGDDAFNHTTDVYWGESDCQAHRVTAATTPRVTFTEDDDGTDIINSVNAAGKVDITITYMKA